MRRFRFTVRWSRVSLLALLLIFPQFAASQGSGFNASRQFITTTVASDIGLVQNNHILYHQIAWIVTGSPASCTVALDSSTDGVTWTATGLMGNQTCTSNGNSVVTSGNAAFMRINVSALSNGATLTVNYTGWSYNPNPSSNGGEWGQIANPTQNQVLNMGAFTTAWTFNDIVGGTDIFSISTTSGPGRLHLCGVTNAGAQSFWMVGNTVSCSAASVSPQANFNVQVATASFTHDAYRAYAAPTGTNYTGTLFQGVAVSTGTGFNFLDFCSGATGTDMGCGAGTHLVTIRGDGLATFNALSLSNALSVANGGIGIASGTSGGILGFTAGTTLASSVALNSNVLVKGGGAGATPTNSSVTDDGTTISSTDTGGISLPNGPITLGGDGVHSGQMQLDYSTTLTACPGTGVICINGPLVAPATSSVAVNVPSTLTAGSFLGIGALAGGSYPITASNTVSTAADTATVPLTVSQGATATVFPAAAVNITQGANTGTTNVPALSITGTWNASGLTATGIIQNITCTAAAGLSNMLSLQVASVNQFNFNFGNANCAAPQFSIASGGSIKNSNYFSVGGSAATVVGGGLGTASVSGATGIITVQGSDNSSTNGAAQAGSTTVRAGNLTGAATNLNGVDLILDGGLGTSTGTPGHIALKTGSLGLASGTTQHALVTRFLTLTKALSTTSATATSIFNVASATNTTWGVELLVHVQLISSTPNVCGTTERISITGTNNNGTFGTVNIVPGTISTLCSAGTLTLAITATAANPSVVSITPTWATITSITSSTATMQVQNLSEVNDVTAASD